MQTKFFNPRSQHVDANGDPIIGSLGFYQTGTSTEITTYSDYDRNTANTNPINADSSGRFGPVFFDPADLRSGIKVVFYDDINGGGSIVYTDDRYQEEVLEWADLSAALTQARVGAIIYPRTDAEAAAGIDEYAADNNAGDITNPEYRPGDIRRYGAIDDNSTNSADAFTAAVLQSRETNGSSVTGVGRFALASVVNMRGAEIDLENAQLNITHSGIGLIIGGNRQAATNPRQKFGKVERSFGTDSASTPTVRVMGAYGQHINVYKTGWFQIYGDVDVTTPYESGVSAYSTYHLNNLNTLEFGTNPGPAGDPAGQWINENQFFINRLCHFIMGGTYGHNHNRFYGGNFEWDTANSTPASIDFNIGSSNIWYDLRFEYNSNKGQTPVEITFDSSARFNKIFQTWTSSFSDYATEAIYGNTANDKITDNGVGNVVVKQDSILREHSVVGHASADDLVFDTTVGVYENRQPSLAVVQSNAPAGRVLSTKKFRIRKGDVIGFITDAVDSNTPQYRLRAELWDSTGAAASPVRSATGVPAPGENYISVNGSVNTVTENRISSSTGVESASFVVVDEDDLAWCQLQVYVTSPSDTLNAGSISLYVRRQPYDNRLTLRSNIPLLNDGPYAVSGVPTEGFAPLGFTVDDVDGTNRWTVTNSVDTTLDSAASAGASSISVDDASTVNSGDVVGILNDDLEVTDWDVVNGSPSGSGPYTVALTGTLTGDCATGNRVVFMRWA